MLYLFYDYLFFHNQTKVKLWILEVNIESTCIDNNFLRKFWLNLYVVDQSGFEHTEVGEIRFHVQMAGGLVPFGPRFQVIDVMVKDEVKWTCLSALMEGFNNMLNFEAVIETLLETVYSTHLNYKSHTNLFFHSPSWSFFLDWFLDLDTYKYDLKWSVLITLCRWVTGVQICT